MYVLSENENDDDDEVVAYLILSIHLVSFNIFDKLDGCGTGIVRLWDDVEGFRASSYCEPACCRMP